MKINELFALTHRHSARELQKMHPHKGLRKLEVRHLEDEEEQAIADEIAREKFISDSYDRDTCHQQ